MLQDNEAMRAMFTLPPPSHSLPLAPQDLPPVENVTGDTEVDAFLWLRTVIGTGSPVLIDKAMEAAKRIKTPPKVLRERYDQWQAMNSRRTGAPMRFFMFFEDLEGLAKRAIEQAGRRNEALKRFGTVDALFAEQPAEAACKRALRGLKTPRDDLSGYDEDKADRRFAMRLDLAPSTLADSLHARKYWHELYWLRNAMREYGGMEAHRACHEHDWFCLRSLSRITPRSKTEAQAVLEHVYSTDVNRDDHEPIVRHLVAAGWQ